MNQTNSDHLLGQLRSHATARPDDLSFYRWQPARGLTGSVNQQEVGGADKQSGIDLVRWITLTPDPGEVDAPRRRNGDSQGPANS